MEAVVHAGGIPPLIAALKSGRLSATAEEHAAAVLSCLARTDENAAVIISSGGLDPLVTPNATQLARKSMLSPGVFKHRGTEGQSRWTLHGRPEKRAARTGKHEDLRGVPPT